MTEHADIQRLNSNQVMSAVTIHNKTVYLSGAGARQQQSGYSWSNAGSAHED